MALPRAVGGLIWVPLTSFIGRAPTLLWSTCFGLVFSIVTAVSPNFTCFYAARALTGLFLTSGQTIAVAFIKDMFFFHERTRKIGLWALMYITSPYWGPLLSNFVAGATHKWQDVFWVCVGVVCIDLILIIAFLDETWYNRDISTSERPHRGRGFGSRILRLTGVWQLRHHSTYFETAYDSFKRFLLTLMRPVLVLVLFA